jgi:starch synthase
MVSREYDGLAGAGGVKDVCRQLAEALVHHGKCRVRVVLPLYGFLDARAAGFKPLRFPLHKGCHASRTDFSVDMNYAGEERREQVSVRTGKIHGVELYLLESERFSEKLGVYTYTAEEEAASSWKKRGSGHFDYFAMNILLQKATLALLILLDQRPDIIHCQDGHAAVLPAMMRELAGFRDFFQPTGCLVTIHNAGLGYHQEVADLDFARAVTGLPERVVLDSKLANVFDPFMAAAGYACLNTVSENYARELRETEEDARTGWLGHALLQKGVYLEGITNGINPEDFNPARRGALGLPASFNPAVEDLAGKRICKESMLRACRGGEKWSRVQQYGSLEQDTELPLFTFIGRLTAQKGVDILLGAVSLLQEKERKFQLLLLGSGDPLLERQLQALAGEDTAGRRICFLKGYDPELANRIYAAGDFFLIPSLYEPCGLTDYIAQLLGNLPVVHHVGGLVKVLDGTTGFAYRDHSPAALAGALERALEVYDGNPGRIARMQRAAVERILSHHTWKKVMQDYLKLYGRALAMRCKDGKTAD